MAVIEQLESEAAEVPPRAARTLRALSLFSGAGGLDLGLEQAKFRVLGQIEMDPSCVSTLSARQKGSAHAPEIFATRIEDIPPRAVREAYGLQAGDLELLAGGPPCQPFTTHGRRRALLDGRAESAFPSYLEYVREFEPKALLMENVDGLLSAALNHRPLTARGREAPELTLDEMKGSFLRWLVSELVGLGYAVSWGVVEAADFGVPQKRQRAILIGVKGDQPCFLPPPTHGPDGGLPYRTLRDALATVCRSSPVQPLSKRKRAVYAHIPPGGNWRDLPDRMQRETMGRAYHATGGKSGWWRRLSWDAPAPTILGMPDHSSTALVHPDEVRCLSVAECAALQSFPRSTLFGGTPRSQYQQIGNAVPPAVGKAMGVQLRRHLDGEQGDVPARPEWRKTSSNRRIGTHGWAWADQHGKIQFHLHVRLRQDHIWTVLSDVRTPPS